jgi:hypothetical protein
VGVQQSGQLYEQRDMREQHAEDGGVLDGHGVTLHVVRLRGRKVGGVRVRVTAIVALFLLR